MCGICAISLREGARAHAGEALAAMNRAQLARGPDGAGISATERAGIGMVRLRVRAGRAEPEPIPLPPSGCAAYNGEAYRCGGAVPEGGAGEARALMEAGGRGVDGMYAMARMEEGSEAIHLMRDPFGIKPLWTRTTPEGVAAASTIGGLLTGLGPAAPRPEAIEQFLAFGRPVDGGTFFEGIAPVPRGGRMTLERGEITTLGGHEPAPAEEGCDPGALREAVDDAIRATLPSNRTLGLAVSGGLDSTILAHRLAAMGVEGLRTVSVLVGGVEDGVADLGDLAIPHEAARGWTHSARAVTPEDFARGFERAPADLGEPTRLSSVPLYGALADAAREAGIVVLLVGEGADELFMGYGSYRALGGAAGGVADFLMPPSRAPYLEALLGLGRAARMAERAAAIGAEAQGAVGQEGTGGQGAGRLDRLRAIELDHSLEPLLRRADHLLMSRSIEGRTPFLHGRVPALALAAPAAAHMACGRGKTLLRAAFPELERIEGPWRRKTAFRAPVADWLAGPLRPWMEEALDEGAGALAALGLRPEGIALVRADAARGRAGALDMALALLSLVFWSRWLRETTGACPHA